MADGQNHREQPTPVWPSAIRHPLSAIDRDVGERHPTCFGSKEPSVRVRPSRLTNRPLFARSSNGSGHCSDKAETKVRLLPGRLGGKLSAISCQPEQIGQDDNTRRTLTCSFSIASNAPRPQRGRGVTAAQRAFNSHGEGSNPSGLTESGAWSLESGDVSQQARSTVPLPTHDSRLPSPDSPGPRC